MGKKKPTKADLEARERMVENADNCVASSKRTARELERTKHAEKPTPRGAPRRPGCGARRSRRSRSRRHRRPPSRPAASRECPTPEGVPVRIRSPGSSVKTAEANATSRRTPKTRSAVFPSWKQLAVQALHDPQAARRRRAPTPARARSPSGQNVSKPFARVHCLSAYWRLRGADVVRAAVAGDEVERVVLVDAAARAGRSRPRARPRSRRASPRAAARSPRPARSASSGTCRRAAARPAARIPCSAMCEA